MQITPLQYYDHARELVYANPTIERIDNLAIIASNVEPTLENHLRMSGDLEWLVQRYQGNLEYTDVLIRFANVLLSVDSTNAAAMRSVVNILLDSHRRNQAYLAALDYYKACENNLGDATNALHMALRCVAWGTVNHEQAYAIYKQLIANLYQIVERHRELTIDQLTWVNGYLFWFNYFEKDNNYRQLLNQLAEIQIERFEEYKKDSRIKIGFVGHTFRSHSVSHILRWLLQSINKDKFAIYCYSMMESEDYITKAIVSHVKRFKILQSMAIVDMAREIEEDELDILIDLDGATLFSTQGLMACHPAKKTISWMGFDGSGITDYLLTDKYITPYTEDSKHREKIIRMEHCYIPCGGFDTAATIISRDELNIPRDAFVYGFLQKPLKGFDLMAEHYHHYLSVIANVENAYLLVKDHSYENWQTFWVEKAAEYGVGDRIRFLPPSPNEMEARINVALCDAILDSFPYNGVVTTLEALWLGVPVVNMRGETWASRQGFTLLGNVGLSELSIAGESWSKWKEVAVRLATDKAYYSEVVGWLVRSRHTVSLWDYQKWVREFEQIMTELATSDNVCQIQLTPALVAG